MPLGMDQRKLHPAKLVIVVVRFLLGPAIHSHLHGAGLGASSEDYFLRISYGCAASARVFLERAGLSSEDLPLTPHAFFEFFVLAGLSCSVGYDSGFTSLHDAQSPAKGTRIRLMGWQDLQKKGVSHFSQIWDGWTSQACIQGPNGSSLVASSRNPLFTIPQNSF